MSIRCSNIYKNPIHRFKHSLRKFIRKPTKAPGSRTPRIRVSPDIVCVWKERGKEEKGEGEREARKMRIAEMDRCLELASYVSAI